MSATSLILSALSPLLVALIRQCGWQALIVKLVSLLVVAGLYSLGQWLDGSLLWPPAPNFWVGLGAAWTVQQLSFEVMNGSHAIKALENVGSGVTE